MKKQLKEEVSRIKNMMRKINESDFQEPENEDENERQEYDGTINYNGMDINYNVYYEDLGLGPEYTFNSLIHNDDDIREIIDFNDIDINDIKKLVIKDIKNNSKSNYDNSEFETTYDVYNTETNRIIGQMSTNDRKAASEIFDISKSKLELVPKYTKK